MTVRRPHARRANPLSLGATCLAGICLALLTSGCVHARRSSSIDCDDTVHSAFHVVSAVAHLCAALTGD